MTAVEVASRIQEQDNELTLTKNETIAYHSKAVGLCVATLKNKERPISTVELLWFGAAGETFPFVIDPELKMNNRMPFSKMKERFPNQLFSQLPCLGRKEMCRGDYRVGYCEIRGYNDASNNILKTAEYLSLNKWVGIINTSEGAKLYLLPTCSVSHELGVTQANHPQMLHGVFFKKNPRESRSHTHRTQPAASSSEKILKESTLGNSSRQWQEEATASAPASRRRVSFAPILTTPPSMSPDPLITKVEMPSSSSQEGVGLGFQVQNSSEDKNSSEETASKSIEVKGTKLSSISVEVGFSSQAQHPVYETVQQSNLCKSPTVDTPQFGEAKDCDTSFSPGSEISEEGSIASSLSSSASMYESPQTAKRGRGKRGQRGSRTRGRGKRGGSGRGSLMVGEANGDATGSVRGGRSRRKRGRGTRGVRGRGRGRGGGSPDYVIQGELEYAPSQPEAKRTKLSLDLVAEKEKSARDNNTMLYDMLDNQAASITSIHQSAMAALPKQLHIQVTPNAQVQLQVLNQAHSKQATTTSQMSPVEKVLPEKRTSPVKTEVHKDEMSVEDMQKLDPTQSSGTYLPMSIITAEGMVVAETDVKDDTDDDENENIPKEVIEGEVKDSDLQVHEEVILSVHGDHEMSDQMEIDSGPYFHPPRPPRRVSLLEYKERMKGKKKHPSDELQQGDSDKPIEKESGVISPLNEGNKDNFESQRSKLQQAILAVKKSPAVKDASGHVAAAVASHFLRSVIDTKMASSSLKHSVNQSSDQQITKVTKKAINTSKDPVVQQVNEPSSIEWPTIESDESRQQTNQESSVKIESENTKEKSDVKNNEPMEVVEKEVQVQVKNNTSVCEQKDKDVEEQLKEIKRKEEMEWAKRLEELEREWRKKKEQERIKEEKEKQRVKDERERERLREERERERLKEEKEKQRIKDERERERLREEREKERLKEEKHRLIEENKRKMARKAAKPVESWKPPSNQKRYNIPIRHGPTFHPRPHQLPLPTPALPPQAPPPQPFIGFPHTPFHQPSPAPYVPPHPRPPPLPQPDVWSMFGNLFAHHNIFPPEEPPLPPPRSPSPPLPTNHFSPPRRKSPRCSPPLHRSRSPPPRIDPPRPRSTSPTLSPHHRTSPEPASFSTRRKSGSPSPVSKPWPLEPKPRQLDAKQFRVISELIKRTTVKKCDVSVQSVPPRMISEGTQDGTGFRLCSTAVQVKARTYNVATLTDCKPQTQDRYVQTSAVPTRNTSTQIRPRSRNVAIQTTRASNSTLVAALDDFDSLLDTVGCTYPEIDAIVSRVEDWLSRQASLSTDTGSTSDYEPEDMSCDEDDEEEDDEDCDGVFVSPEDDTIPSPVVSGASNISDGDLSDIVSPTFDGKTTETQSDKASTQPLVSSNDRVPSPPLPTTSPVADDSASVPPPPPVASSTNRIGSLPPWAKGVTLSTNTSVVAEDDNNSKDIGEAFADQMLEEQFSMSTSAVKATKSPPNNVKLEVDNTKGSFDAKHQNESVSEQSHGVTTAHGHHHLPTTTKEVNPITSQTEKKSNDHRSTIQKKVAALTQQGCSVSDKSTNLSVRVSPLSIEIISKSENTTKDESDKMLHSSDESTVDLQLHSHTTHSVAKESDDQLTSSAELKARTSKHSSAGSNDESDQTTETSEESKSHSASPRRSTRHKQQVTKVQTVSNLSTSKCSKSSTESDDSQDSSSNKNVQTHHKYETRCRKRSEADENQQKELSKREERWKLRSRHKHHTEDSRARSKGSKDDNGSSTNELKRTKGKRVRDDDETEHRIIKQKRERTPPSTITRKRMEEKLMVPTMQAFEDEYINYESGTTVSSPDEITCMQQDSVAEKTKSDNSTKKKQVCEVDLGNENNQEEKDDAYYLRSVSLPPFKVLKTSPTTSPTDKKSPSSSDSPILNPRSISYSPPSSAASKKKPTLTKEELLAMVRAKRRSSLNSPQQTHQPDHTSHLSMNTVNGSDQDIVQSQLNMSELMVNFHKHMQSVSARKVSDASWIHPWSHPSTSSHGVLLPHPKYSLLNPPPPPPGPPPSSVMRICKTPEKAVQTREHKDLSPDSKETGQQRLSDDEVKECGSEEDLAALAGERLQESMMKSAEMRITENTVPSLILESVDESVTERINKEESFEAVFMEEIENMIVEENVADTFAISIADKVTNLVQVEDAIQEHAVQSVGVKVCSELIDAVVDEATNIKAVEIVKAEDILQEKAFEATHALIIDETVAATVDEGVSMEAKYRLKAEENLEKETLDALEKSTVSKAVDDSINVAIDQKAAEVFLQEKAIAKVTEKTMEKIVENAIDRWMCDKVIEVIHSELIDEVANTIEEVILQECEAIIAESDTLEEIVSQVVVLVEENMTEVCIRDSEQTVAVEAEVEKSEVLLDRVVMLVEKDVTESCIRHSEESIAIEAEFNGQVFMEVEEDVIELCIREGEKLAAIEDEFNEYELIAVTEEEVISDLEGELFQFLTDTTVCEALNKEDTIILELEEIVADELQCEYFEDMKDEIVQILVLEEEKRRSDLIEECFLSLEDILISDLVSELILNEALEESVIQNVESTCFEDIQQALIDEIMIVNLEVKLAENLFNVIIEEVVSAIAEGMIVKEENTLAIVEERISVCTDKDLLDSLENEIVTDLVDREESVALATEEQVSQTIEHEVLRLLPGTIAAENVEAEIVKDLGDKVCHTLEELCLDAVVKDSASEKVASQETTAAALEHKVSMDLEEECVNEVQDEIARELTAIEEVEEDILHEIVEQSAREEVVVEQVTEVVLNEIESQFAKEEAVQEHVRDIVLNEIEGQIAKEDVVEEQVRENLLFEIEKQVAKEEVAEDELTDMLLNEVVDNAANEKVVEQQVADELETMIMNHLEDDVAALVADNEERNRISYEVMELFPDNTIRCESNSSTHPHIHVMDRSPSEADHNSTIEYDVTDLVPDPLAQKCEPTHIHLLESNTFLVQPELNDQDLIVRAHAQSPSTYVHFIEQSSSDIPLDSATKKKSQSRVYTRTKSKPPEIAEAVKSPTLKDVLKFQETANQSPPKKQAPPAVFRPTLPKYISRKLRPRAPKPIPSPPGGVEHPMPLSPTSSTNSVVGAPPSEKKCSTVPSTKRRGRKRSTPTSPTTPKRRGVGRPKKSTSVSPGPAPASTSTHQRRPRTRSRSSSGISKPTTSPVTSTAPVVSPSSPNLPSLPSPASETSPLAAPSPSVLTHLALTTVQVPAIEDSEILVESRTSALKTYSPPPKELSPEPLLPLKSPAKVCITLACLKESHLENEAEQNDENNDRSTTTKEKLAGSDVEVPTDTGLESGTLDLLMCLEEPTKALQSGELCALTSDNKSSNRSEALADKCSDLPADLHNVLVEDFNPGQRFDLEVTGSTFGEIKVKDSGTMAIDETSEPHSKMQSSANSILSDLKLPEDSPFLPDALDLSSISLTALENVHSPVVSPVTGNSSSTTVSPRSINDEMILRLEPSFSSAPETDSDQECEQKPAQTTSTETTTSEVSVDDGSTVKMVDDRSTEVVDVLATESLSPSQLSIDSRPAPSLPPPPPPEQKKLDLNSGCPPWATTVNEIDITKQDELQMPQEDDNINSQKVTSKKDLSKTPFLMIVPTSSDSPTSSSFAKTTSSTNEETIVPERDQTLSLQRKTLASLREGTENLTSTKNQESSSPNKEAQPAITDTALLPSIADEFVSAPIPSKSTPTPQEKALLKDDDDLLSMLSSNNNEFMTAPVPDKSRLPSAETTKVDRKESTTEHVPPLSFCEDVLPSTELRGTQTSGITKDPTEVTRKPVHSSFSSYRTTTDRLWQSFADDNPSNRPSLQGQTIPSRVSQRHRPHHQHHDSNYHQSRSHILPAGSPLFARSPEHVRPIYPNPPYLFSSPFPGPSPVPHVPSTPPLYPHPRAPYDSYFQFQHGNVPMGNSAPLLPRIPPPAGLGMPPPHPSSHTHPHHRHIYGNPPPPSRYNPYF